MIDLVISALAKDAATCSRQELLLAILRVCDFLCELFWWPGHIWLLTWVSGELVHHNPLLSEIQLDVVQVLVLVQTNLDATSATAHTLHIVFVQCD